MPKRQATVPPEVGAQKIAFEFPVHFGWRSYQWEFCAAMRPKAEGGRGMRRAALVWHRRAGKDLTALNWTIEAMLQRPGTYNYFFPTYKLGKRILWDGMAADGRPFMSHFPESLVLGKNETEMKVTLGCPNGGHSIFQIIGADEADASSVGTNPVGCVYSEYALMDPTAWNLARPILAENGGWAVFAFTPRGRNHAYPFWQSALRDPGIWFTSLRTVDMTRRDAEDDDGNPIEERYGEPVIRSEDIEAERRNGMAEELIQQEFYCSFEGALVGAYYADMMKAAYDEGRITRLPHDPSYPVDTAWDFGRDDATAIWFTQTINHKCRAIDYLETSGRGLDWYIAELRKLPYSYGRHYAPHDVKVHEFSTNKTRLQFAASKGLHFEPVPKLDVVEGINAARMLFPDVLFDSTDSETASVLDSGEKKIVHRGCARGIAALSSYRREFDERLMAWRNQPLHDWASNGADAFRTRALAWRGDLGDSRPSWARTAYDAHGPLDQDMAVTTFVPNRSGARQAQAITEVEHGEDWWR